MIFTEFKIPPYVYFYGNYEHTKKGNTYTGSIGTDPESGCLKVVTFCYKLSLAGEEEGNLSLLVHYWYRNPWNAKEKITEGETETFEASEAGVRAAEKWLLLKMQSKAF